MKSKRTKTKLGVLMMAAGATFLAACAMEVDGDEEVWNRQSEHTAGDPTQEESMQTAEAFSVSDAELAASPMDSEEDSADKSPITPNIACRRVTASSIAAYTSAYGDQLVLCRFFKGDTFTYFGTDNLHYRTWCPRGLPPGHPASTAAFVKFGSGTVDGGCPIN